MIKIKKRDQARENLANQQKYMVAIIENKEVFLHEAEWVLNNKKLIPEGKLVAHKDGDTNNNNVKNLELVDENKKYGDLYKDKVFHEGNVDLQFIEKYFNDIYRTIYPSVIIEEIE